MKTLYLFAFLLISVNSFLIYEKVPSQDYENQMRTELREIGNLHGLEEAVFSDFYYEKDSVRYLLSNVRAKASFFNEYMPIMSVSSEDEVKVTFSWNAEEGKTSYISPYHLVYRGLIILSTSEQYEIEFTAETSKFELSKTWEKYAEDDFFIPTGSINNIYTALKAKCVNSDCPYSDELLLELTNAFLVENQSFMNREFANNGVIAYYKSLPFDKLSQKLYTQTSVEVSRENNVDLCLEEPPEFNANSDFIFKRKGKLNDLDITGDAPLTEETKPQKFFINKKFITKLISENLFNIAYEQGNNPSTMYELTVKYLKMIADVDYKDSTPLSLYAEMTKVDFDDKDAISGNLTMKVTLIEQEEFSTLLSFNCVFGFELVPTLLYNGLNFVLLSKTISIKKIESDKVTDVDLLKSWIENSYLAALGKNEYNLLTLSFDLSHYFSSNSLSYEFIGDYLSIIKS